MSANLERKPLNIEVRAHKYKRSKTELWSLERRLYTLPLPLAPLPIECAPPLLDPKLLVDGSREDLMVLELFGIGY